MLAYCRNKSFAYIHNGMQKCGILGDKNAMQKCRTMENQDG